MYKYIPLKSIISYIPSAIREQVDEIDIIAWAFDAYKNYITIDDIQYDYKLALTKVVNHKALIPESALGVQNVSYSRLKPNVFEDDDFKQLFITQFPNELDDQDARIIVGQVLIYGTLYDDYGFRPMRYVGQHTSLLDNDCVNLYCKDCFENFSVDKQMKFIKTDSKEGWVSYVYRTNVNNKNEFLIPFDMKLLRGLSFYIEAEYYRNLSVRGNRGAESKFNDRLYKASNQLHDFVSDHKEANINIYAYMELIRGRFGNLHQHPYLSGNKLNMYEK